MTAVTCTDVQGVQGVQVLIQHPLEGSTPWTGRPTVSGS